MKKVIIVMGLPNTGKSTYIHSTFPKYPIVDLWDYQAHVKNREDLWESYLETLKNLLLQLKKHDCVILEHTLLKAKRRKMYIQGILEEYPDAKISIICLIPTLQQYIYNQLSRYNLKYSTISNDCCFINDILEDYQLGSQILEFPKKEEGFFKVFRGYVRDNRYYVKEVE